MAYKNIETKRSHDRVYYQKHRSKILEYQRKYRQENKIKISEYRAIYREKNRENWSEYGKVYLFGSLSRYLEALQKYDGQCAFGCENLAQLVHHMDGKSVRNSTKDQINNELDNLLPLCRPCHAALHAKNELRKNGKFVRI